MMYKRMDVFRTEDQRQPLFLPFILLFMLLIVGVVMGSVLTVHFDFFESLSFSPMLFSGIPVLDHGIVNCFTSYLCNIFISLTLLMLMGMTLFGTITIPIYVLIRGVLSAIRILSFFPAGEMHNVAQSAIIYTPYLSLSSLIILLYAAAAMGFSTQLTKSSLRKEIKDSDPQGLFSKYLTALIFAVAASFMGIILVFIYSMLI